MSLPLHGPYDESANQSKSPWWAPFRIRFQAFDTAEGLAESSAVVMG
jgi:hypothetical protein